MKDLDEVIVPTLCFCGIINDFKRQDSMRVWRRMCKGGGAARGCCILSPLIASTCPVAYFRRKI